MNGGYQIIDFSGYPITIDSETATVIPGIFAKIGVKPSLITNLVMVNKDEESIPIPPFYADFSPDDVSVTAYFASVFMGMGMLSVNSDNEVSITTNE